MATSTTIRDKALLGALAAAMDAMGTVNELAQRELAGASAPQRLRAAEALAKAGSGLIDAGRQITLGVAVEHEEVERRASLAAQRPAAKRTRPAARSSAKGPRQSRRRKPAAARRARPLTTGEAGRIVAAAHSTDATPASQPGGTTATVG